MNKINVGILGYGNLGRGVELAINNNDDMTLVGIFTRRENVQTKNGLAISISKIFEFKDKIDVLILCGGSATDLELQGVEMAKHFTTIDSYDNHARIPQYFEKMNEVAKASNHLSMISVGWDPGLFSVARMLFGAVLPNGKDYTFWGRGVSQGHSDAIRRISGVLDAKQYTIPMQDALEKVRQGTNPNLTTREKHQRECYVVADENADLKQIEKEIITMPNYFADYNTSVHFISLEEFKANHSAMPHGGVVLRSGDTYSENKHILEFKLSLGSNPEFTSSVICAYARAVARMAKLGQSGCITVFDVPIKMLSPKSSEELIKNLL